MQSFIEKFEQSIHPFIPFENEQAVISGHFFTKSEASVAFFIGEIRQTAQQLQQQTEVAYAEIYAKKLLDQIDALQKAIQKIRKTKKVERFISPYRPPRNVHSLPKEKRLVEYRKALRALNEKICWLTEKQYQAKNRANKEEVLLYQQQIQETEFRKIKCLIAIEQLAEE